MTFLLGAIFGIVAGIGLTQLVVTRRQRENWERAIAERRQAERRSHMLAQQVSEMAASYKAEARLQKHAAEKEINHHRYLLRRADSALTAAREARDQQAALLLAAEGNNELESVQLSQSA